MREPVTKFDLDAAFTALNEMEYPKIKRITEGLRGTRLAEDVFDISGTEGLEEAQDMREEEVAQAKLARIEQIVDLDAKTPDEVLPSYVGKYVIQCPQCMTLFYKEKEDLVPENQPAEGEEEKLEIGDTVNTEEKCQHCGNASGYTLVGKIGELEQPAEEPAAEEAPVENKEPTEEVPAEEATTEEENVEPTEEAPTEEAPTEETEDNFNLDDLFKEESEDEEEEKKEESFAHRHNGKSIREAVKEQITIAEDAGNEKVDENNLDPLLKKLLNDDHAMRNNEIAKQEYINKMALLSGKCPICGAALANKSCQSCGRDFNATGTGSTTGWLTKGTLEYLDATVPGFKNKSVDDQASYIIGKTNKWSFGNDQQITSAQIANLRGLKEDYTSLTEDENPKTLTATNTTASDALTKDTDVAMGQDQLKTDMAAVKNAQAKLGQLKEVFTENLENLVEDIDDKKLNVIITESLTNVYDNVNNFEVSECVFDDNKFIVEGAINFKSGITKNVKYVFTSAALYPSNKVILEGYNKSLYKDGGKFIMTTTLTESTLTPVVMSYSYKIGEELVEGYTK